MTCIVGLVDRQNIYIGGDSAGCSTWDMTVRADPKVFKNGLYLLGVCGSFRMAQLLRYSDLPAPEGDLHRFLCTTWVDAVRTIFKEGGYAKVENQQEEGGHFLVGIDGRLFTIDSDYQVGEALDGYDAVGCGANVARGALYASRDQLPRERVLLALQASERWSNGVRGPFMVESI